jgi:hypothetical protein
MTMKTSFVAVCATLACLLIAAEARGQGDGPGRSSVVYENLLVGRLNPLGLKNDLDLMLQLRLLDSDHILFRDSHLAMGLTTSFKPTGAQLGFGFVLQPLAVMRLDASVQWVGHLTPFDNLMSFTTPRVDHSDSALEKLGDAGRNYPTQGIYARLGVLLQVKLGPVAIRNDLTAVYADLDLQRGDTVFYEIEWDVMAPDGGWVLFNNADVLYMADFGLIAGVRYSLTHAVYDDDDFLEGEPTRNPNTPVHKLGPVLGFTFGDVNPGFRKPTVLLMAGWYLKHRFRTGRDVHQGIPCVIVAFAFRGDLL